FTIKMRCDIVTSRVNGRSEILSFDGNALYFSSNRPGGLGGFDIYVSYLKDGNWSTPENLGPSINTAGNDITPHFDGETLYFASDHHFGLGGYDLFTSRIVEGEWSDPKNMGKGVNSPADDYYLTPNVSEGAYYFTSNRLGGRGKDDIYIAYRLQSESAQPMFAETSIPPAVELEDLMAAVEDDLSSPSSVEGEPSLVDVSSSETVTVLKSATMESEVAMMDLSGAKLKSITLPERSVMDDFASVYFIQLASLARSEGTMSNYDRVSTYGQLYRFFKSSSVKIRLGYFASRAEAERVLTSVKNDGFRDAFITSDVLATSSYEVVGQSNSTGFIDDFSPNSNFKVKLASYRDPLQFQVDKAIDLGQIEQWTKGEWTIFILGGFETYEAAQSARIKAKNRGFVDAELVEDDKGILKRVSDQ
ncbi:MAG: SPOR domain-containing protein, partial [Bacteroidota bacterium]